MKRFVLDASVALAWFVDKPLPPYAARVRQALVRDARAVVPALWHLEMANGFAMAQRRRILPSSEVSVALDQIEQLLAQCLESDSTLVSARQAASTAQSSGLSAYDSVYLDLARQLSLPLATLDKRLQAAAKRAGVELFKG